MLEESNSKVKTALVQSSTLLQQLFKLNGINIYIHIYVYIYIYIYN